MGIFRRERNQPGYDSQDILETAYDTCADCGAPVPAGDWLCADCDDD